MLFLVATEFVPNVSVSKVLIIWTQTNITPKNRWALAVLIQRRDQKPNLHEEMACI